MENANETPLPAEERTSAELEEQEAPRVSAYAATYVGYPRRFLAYRWYKPVFVMLLTVVFYLLFTLFPYAGAGIADAIGGSNALDVFDGSYENSDIFTAAGALLELGTLAVFIPALALAASIVEDRPFTSYSSARGGWDHILFFKCLAVATLTRALPSVVDSAISGRTGELRFTVLGLILCTLLGPLQCIAEEYMFRGLLMQTVGSWCRLPLLAVLAQTAVFVFGHPYNAVGKIVIAVEGITFAVAALMAKGLEASSALHIANNMTAFYAVGFGFGEMSSTVELGDLVFSLVSGGAYLLLLYVAGKKRGWFDHTVRDDVTPFNDRTLLRMANRAKRKEQRMARKAEREAANGG